MDQIICVSLSHTQYWYEVVYKIVPVVANTRLVPALYFVCSLVLVYAPLITLCYTVALLFIDLL